MPAFAHTHETTIAAPVTTVHALVSDFRHWPQWSPWDDLDPELERRYVGTGVGASYHWKGNNKAGEGTMRFTAITADRIDVDLEFRKPFRVRNEVVFTLTPVAGGTRVAWTMSGERNPVFAVLGRLFLDKAIGKDFDRGLASLKAAAEAA
ncbi:MAG: SRPBCC family protein [Nocardioidaceae bacterium]|nr:SRPBCC family protein [Nocardioidaceae bacterium]MCL2612603.1 SRPBCC family protein [Nocardioidaceae bacterium]